jgi:hypothetical protein
VRGGHDGVLRPFSCHVVVAHVCVHDRFCAVGPASQQHMALPAFSMCGVRSSQERGSPRSINRGKGKGEPLTSPLSIHSFRFSPSPRPRALLILLLLSSLSTHHLPRFLLSPAMAPPQPIVVLEPLP